MSLYPFPLPFFSSPPPSSSLSSPPLCPSFVPSLLFFPSSFPPRFPLVNICSCFCRFSPSTLLKASDRECSVALPCLIHPSPIKPRFRQSVPDLYPHSVLSRLSLCELYSIQTRRMSQSMPTFPDSRRIIMSELSKAEQEQLMDFLVENDVHVRGLPSCFLFVSC